MSISKPVSSEQVHLASAAVIAAHPSTGCVPDCAQAGPGAPERDLASNKVSSDLVIIDGFTWHSISCICDSCVRNDNTFSVTFNRRDFRPYTPAR
jgi:hypothetical protein